MGGALTEIETREDLARALRHLRRREAHERCLPELTYRELAAKTGWSVGVIGGYFSGKVLPSTSRFDTLVRLLGATPAEQGALATARDRVADRDRAVTEPPRAASPSAPHQLPADVYGFTGRSDQLAELDKLLDGPGVVVAAVSGTAGVGKTTLAVHWAHRVADRFPDGQLYVNLRGFDPAGAPLDPSAAVRGFLVALGVPAKQVPADLGEQTAQYRSLLATRRVLVLLDNAHDAAQVRPLLPGSPGCVVVITSRNRLTGLVATDGARPVPLHLMSAGEARELIARRLSADRVAAEPAAVAEIVARCSGLPLALAIAAARAATDSDLPLARLAAELDRATDRLDALDVGDSASDVRTVLSWSYQMLPEQTARLFRLLGLHPGPDLGVATAASLAGVRPAAARRALVELVRAHLITETASGRFAFHDLLRAYAAELARADNGAEALARLLDHYAHTAYAAAMLVDPLCEDQPPPPPPADVTVDDLAGRAEAMAWFTAEHPALIAAADIAAEQGFVERACQLAWRLDEFHHRRSHWPERVRMLRTGLEAAQRLGDRRWLARMHRQLVGAYAWSGRWEESERHAGLAIALYRELGDDAGQARCHRSLCLALERQGRHYDALEHARQSRDLLEGTDDRAGLAYAFNSVGWYSALVGDFEAALDNCSQAVPLLQESGDPVDEATTWDSLGYAHHHLGRYEEAVACYERALSTFREYGARYYEADTLDHLGDTYRATGDHDAARTAWRGALTIFEELHRSEAEAVSAKLTADRRSPGQPGGHPQNGDTGVTPHPPVLRN
ncbi:tetratricopeptide repeat protein [Micromonospora sp. CPCC 206061]|uniref:tetratricopeptide repeat protein n=1 Tax=Micromonospora sp. CPCC 206061 TaxID=3122410 RepID=UPI002FEF9B2D